MKLNIIVVLCNYKVRWGFTAQGCPPIDPSGICVVFWVWELGGFVGGVDGGGLSPEGGL